MGNKRLIAGGTGFIGQSLVSHWLKQGHTIFVLSRSQDKVERIFSKNVIPLVWSNWEKEAQSLLPDIEVIVNVCGENIAEKRWTNDRKKVLLESRVAPTQAIAKACITLKDKSPRWLNASGIGTYGRSVNHHIVFDEQSALPEKNLDFLVKLASEWEAPVKRAITQGISAVMMRFGAVLSKNGGVLKQLLPLYKMGLGGLMGNGQQPFPWIAMSDLLAAIDFLIEHPSITGPVNFVSPEMINQKQWAKALGHYLNRPTFFWMPATVLRCIFGEMADAMLLNGPWAVPEVLSTHKFKFNCSKIEEALEHELHVRS